MEPLNLNNPTERATYVDDPLPFSLIKKMRLTNFQVLEIVREWYESCPEIFQSEDGWDLEEWVEHMIGETTPPEEIYEYIKEIKEYEKKFQP